MRPKRLIKQNLKKIFRSFGIEVTRVKNCTEVNLLGLKEYSFETIIDIGANVGQFAQIISKDFPNATIHCFEPLPEPYAVLAEWAKSQSGKIISYNLAIGDNNNEQVEIFLHEDHTPSSSLLASTSLKEDLYPFIKNQKNIIVKQKTLDTAINESGENLKGNVLLKLDVQGFEDRVLLGASDTLKRASACILEVCLDKLYEGQADFYDLIEILKKSGYVYKGNLDQAYADDGHCIFIDAVFINKAR